MALKFTIEYRKLDFLFEAGTSRGVLNHKDIWLIKAYDELKPNTYGVGEAGPLKGLSIDDIPDFDVRLSSELAELENRSIPISEEAIFDLASNVSVRLPSVRFGVETALLDLFYNGKRKHFENEFYDSSKPLQINGLVWMGNSELMLKRLEEKMKQGFRCIKIKIGAVDFENEMQLLEKARERFSPEELELRVDANGAFSLREAPQVLERLEKLKVHSIEQPIKAGRIGEMANLCASTPVDIALDEELIGITSYADKQELLEDIKPQFIILKPTLLGGFASTLEWIEIAKANNIGWWITSALESNVGLNAICQFASSLQVAMPQGLGTGSLYKNNIESPLEVIGDQISYNPKKSWGHVMK